MKAISSIFFFTILLLNPRVLIAQTDSTPKVSEENLIVDDSEDLISDSAILEFFSVTEPATFFEGDQALYKFIGRNVKYPALALENDVNGKVIVQFVVEPDSTLSHFQILSKKLGYGLEEEAIRVLKLTNKKWNPGQSNGNFVRMRMVVPFIYKVY